MSDHWIKFRNLCRYYADCVKYSEKSQECLFSNRYQKDFIMPNLPLDWHLQNDWFSIETSNDEKFVRSSLLAASDSEELFIGYPLNSFVSPNKVESLSPIIMFPVSIKGLGKGLSTGLQLQIDRQGISINQDWVEYHIPKDRQQAFLKACEKSTDELGCLDVEIILNYISLEFKIGKLDPNSLDFCLRHSKAENGILKTAVLFVGGTTKYSRTLISELRAISRVEDSMLDKTALAYVFRNPPLPNNEIEGEKRVPLSFTKGKLNSGQFESVKFSLNHPITKVIGPPGTGKSFMAVNLIANEVLNDGRVLFASKNHKAIHAIQDESLKAVTDNDFPLVSFCTTKENENNIDWINAQNIVNTRISRAIERSNDRFNAKRDVGSLDNYEVLYSEKLDIALNKYRDAEISINRYQTLRDKISRFEKLLSEVEEQIANTPLKNKNDPKVRAILEEIDNALSNTYAPTFFEKAISVFQKILKINKSEDDFIINQLNEIAPELANAVFSKKTVHKEVKRLLKILKCREIINRLEHEEIDALRYEESEFNYENLKEIIKKALFESNDLSSKVYVEKTVANLLSINDYETIVARAKKLCEELRIINNSSSQIFLSEDKRNKDTIELFKEFLHILPAWAVTMLSLKHASPCLPGIFTLAIIDEASQCDIPPLIPTLFSAQRAAIIGDPNQFPPVITLKPKRDLIFSKKYGVNNDYKFLYTNNNAFSVVPHEAIILNDHFRCCDGIAEYFNNEFYNNKLILCNEVGRTGLSSDNNINPGMMWKHAPGGDDAEVEATLDYLKNLKQINYSGTIGIISPLRCLVEKLQTSIAKHQKDIPSQINVQNDINTSNGFQGGERDVILFVLGLNSNRKDGQEWYITANENKYIYNVSVSRAKFLFVAIGDKDRAKESDISYIQKLFAELKPLRNPKIGPGEEKLKLALKNEGIDTESQYPIAGRYLDLAIPYLKIDIEVDGQAWHLDSNGCRKADDIHRDILLETLGWHVIRFWHHEIVNDISKCVKIVKDKMKLYKKQN